MYTVILDDGLEYLVAETLEIDGILYTLFSQLENDMNYCFRKTTIKDGEKYYTGLDDRDEFNKVLYAFNNKLNLN